MQFLTKYDGIIDYQYFMLARVCETEYYNNFTSDIIIKFTLNLSNYL